MFPTIWLVEEGENVDELGQDSKKYLLVTHLEQTT